MTYEQNHRLTIIYIAPCGMTAVKPGILEIPSVLILVLSYDRAKF
jgi:hypothetical protein